MDCSNRLRKHVTGIFVCLGKPTKRKWLARRTSCDNIHRPQRLKVKIAHVCFMNKLWVEILPKAAASPFVEFDKCAMLKPGHFQPLGEASTATEQFKASHLNPIM